MAYLRIANLKKSYRTSRTETQQVLNGVNVEFKRGEFVAVLGESGCGKSTFMNILGGLDNDYTGSIVLNGEFMKDYTESQLDDYRKSKVGLVFQSYNLISHMTVRENIEVAMTMSNVDKETRKKITDDVLAQVGLSDYAKKLPNQLSGGQRQRVAIARALANQPEILLADEPTGALDKESAKDVINILKSVAESGRLVIVVTHSQKVASECSRILTIDNGVIESDKEQYKIGTRTPKPKSAKPHNIKFKELFKLAFDNIVQTKKRSILVSIGMSIGIAAVILVFCLSSGITNYVNNSLADSMNALQIQVSAELGIPDYKIDDISQLDGVDYVVEGNYSRMNSRYYFNGDTGTIMMLNSSYDNMEKTFIAGENAESGEIIISEAFARNIYNNSLPSADSLIGEAVKIIVREKDEEKGIEEVSEYYTISGVYEDSSDYSSYACAYLNKTDLSALYSLANKTLSSNILYVYVIDTTWISAVQDSIETMGYTTARDDASVETILGYVDLGTKVLTGFSIISIVVSAIMIFIVTYISVIERTKEIGVLRAVGGRRKDVTTLFILESGMIGAIAGIIAVIFSLFISIVANLIMKSSIGGNLITLSVLTYFICLVVSVFIGVGSGLMPSLQAANLDPVEALRSE